MASFAGGASLTGGASFTAGAVFAVDDPAAGDSATDLAAPGSLVVLAADDFAGAFAGAFADAFASVVAPAGPAGVGSAILLVSAFGADFAAVFEAAGFGLSGADSALTDGLVVDEAAEAETFTDATLAEVALAVATDGPAAAAGAFALAAAFAGSLVGADAGGADFTEVFLLGVAVTISALAFAVVAAALEVAEVLAGAAAFADGADADTFDITGAAFVGLTEVPLAGLGSGAGALFVGDFNVAAAFAESLVGFAGEAARFVAGAVGAAAGLRGAPVLTAGFAFWVDFDVMATVSPSSPFGISPGCPERTAQATANTSVHRANCCLDGRMRHTARATQPRLFLPASAQLARAATEPGFRPILL